MCKRCPTPEEVAEADQAVARIEDELFAMAGAAMLSPDGTSLPEKVSMVASSVTEVWRPGDIPLVLAAAVCLLSRIERAHPGVIKNTPSQPGPGVPVDLLSVIDDAALSADSLMRSAATCRRLLDLGIPKSLVTQVADKAGRAAFAKAIETLIEHPDEDGGVDVEELLAPMATVMSVSMMALASRLTPEEMAQYPGFRG